VLLVVTTGGKPVENIPVNPLPKNVRVEKFIPHVHLLPKVDVMITNGGYNGVQVALSNGVPLVAAGETEDKIETCVRIEWAGVGINLKTKSPTPEQIRTAVKTILGDARYKQKAQTIQADYAQYNAPDIAVSLLERLAATKAPVYR
jgi:UDP:flavonoid glycosyltransferase YjiC (YdhE family)